MSPDGIIEAPGIILLFACLLRCLQYVLRSHIKHIKAFWLAAVLVFFAVIRRELNYLPDLLVPSNFLLFDHSYDWWEDAVLTLVYLMIVSLLVYSWRYLWSLLKSVPVSLYLAVVALVLFEYMGENAILIPEALGVIVEELSETAVYAIALVYLWRLDLHDYNFQAKRANKLDYQTASQ